MIFHFNCSLLIRYSFSRAFNGWKVSAAKSLIALLFKNKFVKLSRPWNVYRSKWTKSLAKIISFWRRCCWRNTPLCNVANEFWAIFKSINDRRLWNDLALRLEIRFSDKFNECNPIKLCNNKSFTVVNLLRRKFNVSKLVSSANAKSSMYSNSFSDKSSVFIFCVWRKTMRSSIFNWFFAKINSSRFNWFLNSNDGKCARRLPNKLITVKSTNEWKTFSANVFSEL